MESAPNIDPSPRVPDRSKRLVGEVLAAFSVSLLSTVALYRLRSVPVIHDNLHALVGTGFLLIPIFILQRRDEDFTRFGIALGGLFGGPSPRAGIVGLVHDLLSIVRRHIGRIMTDFGFATTLAVGIFPLFWLGFRIYWAPANAFDFRAPEDFASVAVAQLVVVGLPEEFFYRGYMQTRLHDLWPRRVRLFGAELSPLAIVGTSTLFALGHYLVDLDPARLAVFFPSLLFGWIRQKRGTIGAAAVFHALCNVFADVLMIGYFGDNP